MSNTTTSATLQDQMRQNNKMRSLRQSDSRKKVKTSLHQVNRLLIAALSILGILLDGWMFADLLVAMVVIQWLWLDECDAIELKIVERFMH